MEAMEEMALRRQADEALYHAIRDPAKAAIARIAFQMVINGQTEAEVRASIGRNKHPAKVDLAERRRATVEANFRKLGFEISVPKPNVSNTTLKRWRREGRELFYCPPTAFMSYGAWMTKHGQGNHATVKNEADCAKVGWENVTDGYWFTAEIAHACPRLNMSWDYLTVSTKLLSLEEYAIVYWTHRDLTGVRIDVSTFCLLRTRCGLVHLAVDGHLYSGLRVYLLDTDDLAHSQSDGGGRAVEVVLAPAA